ncbi:MAG: carbohydrate ABC transporter permease [Actinomycetales bacterium]|nr:carbohydrate ABC transporter permease [Actinomycetales bacterium]
MSSNKSFIGRLKAAKIGTTLVMLFVVVLWFMPTAGLLVTAFRTKTASVESGWWTAIFDPFNQVWTIDAFKNVLFSEQWNLADAFMNTLGIAVPSTILPITFAAFAAYGFTFLNFKFKEGWFALIIALMIVPLQAVIVAILQMFGAVDQFLMTIPGNEYGDLKLSGNYPAGWIVHAAFAMPLAVYILRNYMMTLPSALIEAARIDGASHFQIFWRLIIPMSVPALASFAIFQFLWVWNDYFIAYLFVGDKPVMTYQILSMLGQHGEGWQVVMAGSLISVIVPLTVFFSLQRYFVRGLTAGSVK